MTHRHSHSLEYVLHGTYGNSLVGHYTQLYIPPIDSSNVENGPSSQAKK